MTRRHGSARGPHDPLARAKVWLEIDGHYVFGHGISEILQAVADTGSIKEAARSVGKSYRHVWSRIKEAEEAIGAALVHTQVGGADLRRSELTQFGRDLVREFDAMRHRVLNLVEREYQHRLLPMLDRYRQHPPLPTGAAGRTSGPPCRKPCRRKD